MLKIICLLVIGGILFSCFAEKKEDNYRLFYPKNIPVNSIFDVALVTSNISPPADTLELYLAPGSEISLSGVAFHSSDTTENINIQPANLESMPGQVYKCSINLADSSISEGAFFQVVITLKAEYGTGSNLKVLGLFKDGDKIVGTLGSNMLKRDFTDNFITAGFNFYKPLKEAGRCLNFDNNSSLQISLNDIATKNLLTEFWIKFDGSNSGFLNISSKNNSYIYYSLSINPFQMLVERSAVNNPETISPIFISRGSWYHISVDVSLNSNLISVYCGSRLLCQSVLPELIKLEDLVFSFNNNDRAKSFQIDLLRFIDLENSIDVSFANQNYLNFVSDSSTVLSQFDFDDQQQIYNQGDNISLSYSNIHFVRSSAPLFTRAPELNITPFSSAYELDWSGGDYRQAANYVLQKSKGNSGFIDLFSVPADNNSGEKYSYTDQQDGTNDVVYYRVKQVNIDGSSVYSDMVKVGQGSVKPFVVQQNYPNPFNPNTSIAVTLIEDSQIEISVYNIEGKEIQQLYKGYLTKGSYTFNFDAVNLPSGIYFCKVATPNFSEMKKMIYTK